MTERNALGSAQGGLRNATYLVDEEFVGDSGTDLALKVIAPVNPIIAGTGAWVDTTSNVTMQLNGNGQLIADSLGNNQWSDYHVDGLVANRTLKMKLKAIIGAGGFVGPLVRLDTTNGLECRIKRNGAAVDAVTLQFYNYFTGLQLGSPHAIASGLPIQTEYVTLVVEDSGSVLTAYFEELPAEILTYSSVSYATNTLYGITADLAGMEDTLIDRFSVLQ